MFCKAEENKKKRVYSSAHAPEEWSKLYGKPQYELGVWSIVFSTVCQILYIPALRVFYRERKLTSYKIMLFVALADVGALSCFGTLFGYTMIRGMVFCSDWKLAWFVGSGEGRPSTLYIAATIVYGLFESLFTRPPVPNSTHQFCAFNAFIPGHAAEEYPNRPNMYHDTFLATGMPALFIVMCGLFRTNSMIKTANATQALQAKIFTQASFVCFFFGISSAVWVFEEFFYVPPPFFLTAGMVMVQGVHGLPCLIYLALNRQVQKEAWRMIGKGPVAVAKKKEGEMTTPVSSINMTLSVAYSSTR
ncbi:hypothetical protein PRIPAC_79955 [Pristionchus pacificus]|nr:hypothetical protein PRIPAC_79955 [Pristionchus pacificus]